MHAVVIALFLTVFVADAMGLSGGGVVAAPLALAVVWLSPALIAGVQWWVTARAARALDRTGDARSIAVVDAAASTARWCLVVMHAFGVLLLGALGASRSILGDVFLLDELAVLAPPLLGLAAGFVMISTIDRRIREAALIRDMDAGRPVGVMPGVWSLAWMQTRHQILIVVVPVMLVMSWGEGVDAAIASGVFGESWAVRSGGGFEAVDTARELLTLPGVVLVLMVMPFVLRRLWHTAPMPDELGRLIDEIAQRHRVRPGPLLVWFTHGTMVNGAMVGLFWPARMMLLTDRLIERFPRLEVLAVAAHEVAHARANHLPWMIAGVVAAVLGSAGVADLIGAALVQDGPGGGLLALGWTFFATPVVIAFGFGVFLTLSRCFEWQADAFAAKEINAIMEGPSSERVGPAAVAVVAGALGRVAASNGISPRRRAWRHGSIALRQRKLRALEGERLDGLAIDRRAKGLKLAVVVGIVVAAGLLTVSTV